MLEFEPMPMQQEVAVDGLSETLFGSSVNEISSAPLGTVVSDQEILQDLDRVLKQSEDGTEQAICGCQTSCGCANCNCSSGDQSNNPLESEMDEGMDEGIDEYRPNPLGQSSEFDRNFLFSKVMSTLESLSPLFEDVDSSYQLVLEMPEQLDLAEQNLVGSESTLEILEDFSSIFAEIDSGYQVALEMLGNSNVIEQSFINSESSVDQVAELKDELEPDFSGFTFDLSDPLESVSSQNSGLEDTLERSAETTNPTEAIDSTDSTALRSNSDEFSLSQWIEQFKAVRTSAETAGVFPGFSITASSFDRSAPLANPSINRELEPQAVSEVFNQIRLHLKPLNV
jgi:hypothetical protein